MNTHQSDVERLPKRNRVDPFEAIDRENTLLRDRPEIRELAKYAKDLKDKTAEELELGYIEFEFNPNRLAYVRNGLLLAKFKFLKLHNDTIKAARVTMKLIYAGFDILPTNIS